jgi:hypothetical protein
VQSVYVKIARYRNPKHCYKRVRYMEDPSHPRHRGLKAAPVLHFFGDCCDVHTLYGRALEAKATFKGRRGRPIEIALIEIVGGSDHHDYMSQEECNYWIYSVLNAVRPVAAAIAIHVSKTGRTDFHLLCVNRNTSGRALWHGLINPTTRLASRNLLNVARVVSDHTVDTLNQIRDIQELPRLTEMSVSIALKTLRIAKIRAAREAEKSGHRDRPATPGAQARAALATEDSVKPSKAAVAKPEIPWAALTTELSQVVPREKEHTPLLRKHFPVPAVSLRELLWKHAIPAAQSAIKVAAGSIQNLIQGFMSMANAVHSKMWLAESDCKITEAVRWELLSKEVSDLTLRPNQVPPLLRHHFPATDKSILSILRDHAIPAARQALAKANVDGQKSAISEFIATAQSWLALKMEPAEERKVEKKQSEHGRGR